MDVFGIDLQALEYWHWLTLGGLFLVFEVLTMGFFFLWFGVSAIILGLIVLAAPAFPWELQWSLWGMLAIMDLFAWKIFMAKKLSKGIKSDEPHLNKRGDQYIDRVFTLEEPIMNGFGKVKVDDSTWKIECETDLEAGSKVRVTGLDGTVLKVEEF